MTDSQPTATFGGQRVLCIPLGFNLGFRLYLTQDNYQEALAACQLPTRLRQLIFDLYGRQVVWQFRIFEDELIIWLPEQHVDGPPELHGKTTALQALDLFCQALTQHTPFATFVASWDQNRTLALSRGVGYELGEAGLWLVQVMRWACSG